MAIWRALGPYGTLGVLAVIVAAGLVVTFAYRWAVALAELGRGLLSLGQGKPVRTIRSRSSGPVGALLRSFNNAIPTPHRQARKQFSSSCTGRNARGDQTAARKGHGRNEPLRRSTLRSLLDHD
jgi:hypothetical protein